jgi:hypothetical protein
MCLGVLVGLICDPTTLTSFSFAQLDVFSYAIVICTNDLNVLISPKATSTSLVMSFLMSLFFLLLP